MAERFDIVPELKGLLASHGLDGVESFFHWERGERLDKKRLEPWRQRWRISLADGAGQDRVFYLKRFDRPPLRRQLQRWWGGQAGRSSAAVEWQNALQLGQAGLPAVQPAAFGECMVGPIERRSFILLQEVEGESLERICGLLKAAGLNHLAGWRQRRRTIDRLAGLVGRFHRHGFVHRDLYLSHIFLDPVVIETEDRASPREPAFSLIDLQRVFKPKWCCRRWVIKDLAALNISTPTDIISQSERFRFLCRYVRECRRFGTARRLAGLIERKTQRMRRRVEAGKDSRKDGCENPGAPGLAPANTHCSQSSGTPLE